MRARGRIRDRVTQAVLEEFQPRFIGQGRVVWTSDDSDETTLVSRDSIVELGLPSAPTRELPNVVIHDPGRHWLVLVDVASLRGQMTAKRCELLKRLFHVRGFRLVLVNAFASRRQLQDLFVEFPWRTSAWIAAEPEHLIHFNAGYLLGPTAR